jgi:hypothetical protein
MGKGCERVNMVQIHAHIYVNGKMRPIEIMPGGVADKGE